MVHYTLQFFTNQNQSKLVLMMGIDCLNSFWNNQAFIIFMIKICVTLNHGQGQYH